MCFLYYFQQHNQTLENIFQSIFWNAIKHLKIFSFLENSISEKYFTWTKHSLKANEEKKCYSSVVNSSNTTISSSNQVPCGIFL